MMIKLFLIISITVSLYSKDIYVKYRGYINVDNGNFEHIDISYSSLVKDIFYDKENEYLLVKLNSTYYHYCGVIQPITESWFKSSSLGRYYLQNIKGKYDCRVFPMPKY